METQFGNGAVALSAPHGAWGVLRVRGADASRFLHSQLSHDFMLLPQARARLAAWCSPQGRMLASFIALRAQSVDASPDWLLICRSDLLESSLQRLRMFVLRSQVQLSNDSAQWAIYGLLGQAARQAWGLADDAKALPDAYSHQHNGAEPRHLVWLAPAADTPRVLCVQAATAAAPTCPALPASVWNCSDICSGHVHISSATAGLFVPQMLNWESIDAVSFKKGCYPGQEIVARSQFRGAIKRRGCIATAQPSADTVLPQAAEALWLQTQAPQEQNGAAQPCGTVAQSALGPQGDAWIYAALPAEATAAVRAAQASLYADAACTTALQLRALPYALAQI